MNSEWTIKQPSKSGWYWRKFDDTIQCVLVKQFKDRLVTLGIHGFWTISDKPDVRVLWAGPIIPPSPP